VGTDGLGLGPGPLDHRRGEVDTRDVVARLGGKQGE
jgi:hypothetical protein